jgi:hypothetical protein
MVTDSSPYTDEGKNYYGKKNMSTKRGKRQ